MGFKWRYCYVVGGSEEFPTGTTKELRRSRAEVLLKKCAQCVIDCDCGWALDTSRCPTMNDFIDIQCGTTNNSLPSPGLLFINSISGCKMLMFYEPNNTGTKDYNGNTTFRYTASTYHSGLCVSIIPGGSESIFGDPSLESFYPADATRVCGTAFFTGTRSNYAPAAHAPEEGVYHKYNLLVAPDCFAVCVTHGTTLPSGRPAYPIYATGKIFGELAHSEDNLPQAKYGTIIFRVAVTASTGYEGHLSIISFSQNSFIGSGGSSYTVTGRNTATSNPHTICFATSQGTWLNEYNNNTQAKFYYPYDWRRLGPDVHSLSITGVLNWSAFAVILASNDRTTYGIVPGDCFKGFLDTNYFRAAGNADAATIWGGGKFLYPEANLGLLIGWDPSND